MLMRMWGVVDVDGLLVGMQTGISRSGNQCSNISKDCKKICQLTQPHYSWAYIPRVLFPIIETISITGTFIRDMTLKQPGSPSKGEWIMKIWCPCTMETSFSYKEK